MEIRYNNLSSYLKKQYQCKIKKICIDGGFTCPNRDGAAGFGGCIFCGDSGAGEHIANRDCNIEAQVNNVLNADRKDTKYIAYFQNFTNTYSSVDELREKYYKAIASDKVIILDIGTRPDCIDEDKVKLLVEISKKKDVWIEFGLQTANDDTALLINRGYKSERFTESVEMLNECNIKVVMHLILGLPGENKHSIQNTIEFINKHRIWGIKIHSLYVMKGTALEQLYLSGKFTPISLEENADWAVEILTHISPQIVIHRLTGDCPEGLLIAPDWNANKNNVLNKINNVMLENNYYQGCFHNDDQNI